MSSLKNQSNKTQTTSCIWFIPTYTVRDPTAILLKFTWHWIEQGKSLTNWRKHVSLRGSRKEYSITKNILPRYVIWGAWKLMSAGREAGLSSHYLSLSAKSFKATTLLSCVDVSQWDFSTDSESGEKKKEKDFSGLEVKIQVSAFVHHPYLIYSKHMLSAGGISVTGSFVILDKVKLPCVRKTVRTPENNGSIQRCRGKHTI